MRHLAFLVAILVAPVAARASDPLAVYTVPTRVDLLPDEANANHVVLHGAFFFRQKDGRYGDPACGQMYFACKAGQEAMCRMQWQEIRKNIGANWCTAFGDSQMVTTATLRAEGAPLVNPDPWSLGVGIGIGGHVDGKCAPARALSCPLGPSVDAGVPTDLSTLPPAVDLATPSIDLAKQPAPDLAKPVSPAPASGCSVGGATNAELTLLLLGLVAFAVMLRRCR